MYLHCILFYKKSKKEYQPCFASMSKKKILLYLSSENKKKVDLKVIKSKYRVGEIVMLPAFNIFNSETGIIEAIHPYENTFMYKIHPLKQRYSCEKPISRIHYNYLEDDLNSIVMD